MSERLSFGITTYNYPPDQILELAGQAERLGFEGLWFGEHYVSPRSYAGHHPSRSETPKEQNDARDKEIIGEEVRISDPWFLMGAVAGVTRRLMLGTAICIAPLLHPLVLARATITAYQVSNGRFRLGAGTGWLREEFDALAMPFETRGARLDETVDILRKAWAGGWFDHQGEHFRFDALQVSPDPAPVPLILGGNSGAALRRVARVADGWINSAKITAAEAVELRETLARARQAQGTAHRSFDYFVRPHTPTAEDVGAYLREGFSNIVLWGPDVWPLDPAIPLERKVARLEAVARDLGITPAVPDAA